jgi:hypothetical protein
MPLSCVGRAAKPDAPRPNVAGEAGADTATDHTSFDPSMQVRLFVGGLIWELSSALHFVLDLLFGQDGC